jgi:hypothetical protein
MTRGVTVVLVVLAMALAPSCRRSRRARGSATAAAGAVANSSAIGVPSAAELEGYVTGAGAVELGMTESEVSAALGKKPTRRQDATSPGAPAEMAWDNLEGARPGFAAGQFHEGRLARIEFAPAKRALPRVDQAAVDSLTTADVVRRSVARTLRMADIEAVTRVPGFRATLAIASGFGVKTTVYSRWFWEIEPGGKVLYVDDEDGFAGQPVVRSMK